MSYKEAKRNIEESIKILSNYSKIESFRAPNLQLPEGLVEELESLEIKVDSSIATYKPGHSKESYWKGGVLRLPVTATSSTIRLPRKLALRATLPLHRPFHVLFYHPWEFTRIQRRPFYRPDVWVRTGNYARNTLSYIIDVARKRNYRFALVREAPALCEGVLNG